MAKARLYNYLQEHKATTSIKDMTVDDMMRASKAKSLRTWLIDGEFSAWWFEKDTLETTVKSYQEIAVSRLCQILESDIEGGRDAKITSKDVLNAAKVLLELGDAFPKSKKEVIFADKQVTNMSEDQVEKELKEYKKKLSAVKS